MTRDPAMNQKIFSMDLGVEAVSLYLLCCAVADAGAAITPTTLAAKWNGSPEALERELGRLEAKNVLLREAALNDADRVYRLVDEKRWH